MDLIVVYRVSVLAPTTLVIEMTVFATNAEKPPSYKAHCADLQVGCFSRDTTYFLLLS